MGGCGWFTGWISLTIFLSLTRNDSVNFGLCATGRTRTTLHHILDANKMYDDVFLEDCPGGTACYTSETWNGYHLCLPTLASRAEEKVSGSLPCDGTQPVGTKVGTPAECGTCFSDFVTGLCANPPSSWMFQVSVIPVGGPTPGVAVPGPKQGNLTGFPTYPAGSVEETTYQFVSCVASGFLNHDIRSWYGTDQPRNGDPAAVFEWITQINALPGASECNCYDDTYGLKGEQGKSVASTAGLGNGDSGDINGNDPLCVKFGSSRPNVDCPTFCQVSAEFVWISEGTTQWYLANAESLATTFESMATSLENAVADLHDTNQDTALLDLTPQAQFNFLTLLSALLSAISFLLTVIAPEFPLGAALVGFSCARAVFGSADRLCVSVRNRQPCLWIRRRILRSVESKRSLQAHGHIS